MDISKKEKSKTRSFKKSYRGKEFFYKDTKKYEKETKM